MKIFIVDNIDIVMLLLYTQYYLICLSRTWLSQTTYYI